MKLKLKENPREWMKFALVWCGVVGVVSFLLNRKGIIDRGTLGLTLTVAVMIGIAAVVVPGAFRGIYRSGMTASFHVGQLMGAVILSLIFFLVVTPMGLLLRLMGKDLLELKRSPGKTSYWKPARPTGKLEQQF
jgi:hypothetical protein